MSRERERTWLLDMLQAAQEIVELSAGLTLEAFLQSKLHHHAIVRLLMILGEAAKHVPGKSVTRIPGFHGGESPDCAMC
jgi:uncharacterized protein with HEPN domain